MILLDSSVVFDFERGKDTKLVAVIPTLPCWVCGVTRAEALQVATTPAKLASTRHMLSRFPVLGTPEAVWDQLGGHFAALRAAGLPLPFPDVLIAAVAVYHDFELWTRDAHFIRMQAVVPALRLFAEPP